MLRTNAVMHFIAY